MAAPRTVQPAVIMLAPSSAESDSAASPLAVAEGAADSVAEGSSSPWPSWSSATVSLAKLYALAARGVALMPVPLVQADGCSGSVEVNVISAHFES
jgi:hypothetical protein